MSEKMRIVLRSFDHYLLDMVVKNMISLIKREKIAFNGPIPLPVERTVWTVNKGPHIDKTARNQYEQICHKRMFQVSSEIKSLANFSVPAGVEISIKFI